MSERNMRFLRELFSIVSTDSILVMTSKGDLKRLHCPFMVISKIDFPEFNAGDTVQVDAVKVTLELKDVFIIKGKAYYVWFFRIMDF